MVQRAVFVFLLLLADMSIALASNGVWRSIGPFDGSVNSIAIDAKNSDTVYVGNVAGIFKTTDGGASWSSINPGVYPQVLVVDRQNSQTIFAGTISGILKSVDGGANWHSANLGLGTTPGSQGRPGPYAGVSALTIDPETADILYAATNVGLFKSRDGGASWVDANAGLPTVPVGPGTVRNLPVYLVAIAPRNPTTIYAGGSDVFYMDGRLACCKTALFKSTDGGTTWNTLSLPVPPTSTSSPAAIPPISSLVIDGDDPNTLYVTRGGCNCSLTKSTDGGVTWQNSGPTFPNSSTVIPMSRITADASVPNIFYGQTSAGFVKSTDHGVHWTNADLPSNLSAYRIAANAGTVYVGASTYSSNVFSSGLFKSTDAAEKWENVSTGLSTAFVTTLAIDPQNPSTIYAGGNGIVKSTDAGSTWTEERGNFYALTMAMDPRNSRTLYVGTWDGDLGGPASVFTSTDAGSTWNAAATVFPGSVLQISSVAVDPYDSSFILAAAFPGLFKSTDGGANWDAANNFAGNYIRSIIFDPLTSGTVYVSAEGGVWKSTDAGVNWELANADLPGGAVLAIDAQNPKTLYAAISYPKMVVFKSLDGGHSWTDAGSSGLPNDANQIAALIIDPKNSNTLYLATSGALLDSCTVPCSGLNDGVFRSKDGGATWFAVNFGLTTPHVFALSIDPQNTNRLYAGTLGGGVFSITFAPTPVVSGLQFDRANVVEGTSYIATFAGQNLDSETFFDVQFTAPAGSSGVALNWQRGAFASHDVTSGTAVGSWTITGVRPHEFDADHNGSFFGVSATITVSP
jgi:photosystem II stability/assembly factor-like uncharacterized protein